MVRRRSCAVSNHEGLILRDAAKWPLLRMRSFLGARQIEYSFRHDAEHLIAGPALDRVGLGAQPGARAGAAPGALAFPFQRVDAARRHQDLVAALVQLGTVI